MPMCKGSTEMPTQVARVGVSHRCCNFLDTECRVEEQTMGGFSPREVNSHPEARSAATAELSRQVARRHTALLCDATQRKVGICEIQFDFTNRSRNPVSFHIAPPAPRSKQSYRRVERGDCTCHCTQAIRRLWRSGVHEPMHSGRQRLHATPVAASAGSSRSLR